MNGSFGLVLADGQHRGRDVAGDRLRQQVGQLGERADHRRVVLVAPARDEARGKEQHDGLRHREPQRRQEELAIDAVVAAPGLEDGDRELLLERADVAVHRAGRHPGEARDLADRHPVLAAPLRIEDRGDAQEARQPVALAADAVVAALVVPAVPLVTIGHGLAPVATGRDGSDDQSLHDPS